MTIGALVACPPLYRCANSIPKRVWDSEPAPELSPVSGTLLPGSLHHSFHGLWAEASNQPVKMDSFAHSTRSLTDYLLCRAGCH